MASIDTDPYSADLRARAIRPESREILISKIEGSDQEFDLTNPPNAGGFGRIRHFNHVQGGVWPDNPLPVVPAARALGKGVAEVSTGEVFQNAACNWRCWYCYVPFSLLSANEDRSGWLTADQLVSLYMEGDERPLIIDCSGGQPDLVPEWIPWMMDALETAGLSDHVYLWSDDNLSNDYFWQYLDSHEIRKVSNYKNYGRVCCFKGYDTESFAFNTKAAPELFDRQFDLFKRLYDSGIDLYAYATLTGPPGPAVERNVLNFLDRLQEIDVNLPLRLVPLRIEVFGTVAPRVRAPQLRSLDVQEEAISVWNSEVVRRFSEQQRLLSIADVEWAAP